MWIFEHLIEAPAKAAGYVVGGLLHGLYIFLVFGMAYAAARSIYGRISTPILNVLAATILGLWVLLVVAEAERFIALGFLQSVDYTSSFVE